jgi:aminopeptidase N
MKKILCGVVGLVFVCGGTVIARADADDANIECVKSENFLAPPDAAGQLNYAPDKEVAVLHFALDVTPDFKERTVAGTAVWNFKPMAKPVQEIKLDAVGLKVESVTATEKIQAYQATEDHLIITFADPIPADKEASVTIKYHAEPDLGLYFRTPEMGYKEGDTHCFSQGEEIEARHWYPCFDSPNEKFTSEVTCHVPDGMTAVSNGRLVSQEKDAATGLTAFHWSQEQPHANYLITLCAGYFKILEGKHKDVPLAYLTPPSEFAEAESSFRETDGIMDFFEHEIGVPFPWAKYDQICVNDFVAGGMENTSATTLTDSTLFRDDTETLRDSQSLESHEMAHQWFGDLVTCKDWSHIWLNEGFATYYQILFNGHRNGRDAMLYDLYGNARRILQETNDVNPIVRRDYGDPSEMFGYLAYQKGAWVLHMLRSQLGEDLYRRCIKTYLERHRYGNVTTEDLRAVIEELSGRSYDQFFNQWVYHAHYPELAVDYSWDERTKLAKISVRQTQDLSEKVLLFDFPLTIRFKGKFGTADRVVEMKEPADDFYFPLDSAPEIVRVDPDYTLLAKIDFDLPDEMLFAQLADQSDMVGRLLAIEKLSERHDKETVAKLKTTLNNDSFYGVRVEAAKALRTIHTDEALAALLDSGKQPDARARRAVVMEAGGFFRDTARDFTLKVLADEKNPGVESAAIQSLGVYETPMVHDLLVKFLNSESYREELAGAAIFAIRTQGDPAYIAPLMTTLSNRQAELPSRTFSLGLGTLASLAHNEEKKDAVREFLIAQVNSKKQTVQRAAITALGTLGDPQAVAVLTTFATASEDSPLRAAAEQAIIAVRTNRKPADDLKNLRTEVMDLQKSNRGLRKDVDDLKKKIEALGSDSPVPGKKRKSSPQKDSGEAGTGN